MQTCLNKNNAVHSVAMHHAALICVGCLVAFANANFARGDELTARYFEQLRARRLFSLAEGECLRQLSTANLPSNEQAEFTLELSRTFTEHAKYATGNEQADLWKRAEQTIADFLKANPQHPRRLLLAVQGVFISASQGEYLRWQTKLFSYDDSLKKRSSLALETSIQKLSNLEKTLTKALSAATPRIRRPAAKTNESLSSYELRRLLYNVRYRLGIALHDHAQILPPESPNRIDALMDAEGWFRPLAGGLPGEEMTWNSQVFLAQNNRLRGNFKQADKILAAIIRKKPPTDIHDRIVAERVRLLLAEKRFTDAVQLLIDHRKDGQPLSGELLFLNVKTVLALWEIAANRKQNTLAGELMQQAKTHVEYAEREVGGFWAYRCRLILEFAVEAREYGVELAPLTRQARSLYGAGKTDEAIAIYGEAAKLAYENGQNELAMRLGYTRASILLKGGKLQEAGESFRLLSERFPSDKQAANAHLLWAYSLGKLYDQRKSKQRREAYTNAITAHREKFAEDPTFAEATWMLAQLEEQRLQYTKALQLYLDVSPNQRRGPDAQVAVARCYEWILNRLRELKQPTDKWEAAAIDQLSEFARLVPGQVDEMTTQQTEVMLRLARIYLNRQQPDFTTADRLLERIVLSRPSRKSDDTKKTDRSVESLQRLSTTATQLRIVSLAGQNRISEATKLVNQLSESGTTEVISVLDGLMQIAVDVDDRTKEELGKLQLKAAESLGLRRSQLDDEQTERLDRCLAQALVATGQSRRAIEVYEKLLEKSPRDKRMLRTVSGLLIACRTKKCFEKAKRNWQKLESFEKAGSLVWFEARYHVAWCCYALKQYGECKKLVGVTRLLYPELGGDALRLKFTQLETDAKKATGD